MNKIYQVIFQDEYNNLYLLGFYDRLEDATEDINDYLEMYDAKIKDGDIKEYVGTLDYQFDTYLDDLTGIGGFILDEDYLITEIKGERRRAKSGGTIIV